MKKSISLFTAVPCLSDAAGQNPEVTAEKKSKRKNIWLILIAVFIMMFLPAKGLNARSVYWYGKYMENMGRSRRAVRFKTNKIVLKGDWRVSARRLNNRYKERKIRKAFKLQKTTRYYIQNLAASNRSLRKVSKKTFRKTLYRNDIFCSFRIKKGKVMSAVISKNIRSGPWIITQYGNESGSQQMCYTLTNLIGDLVIIDGGLRSNSQVVRKIITDHGNRVKSWILTHPHIDHAGAFLEIMGNQADARFITVERIYVPDVNAARMRDTAKPSDSINEIERYFGVIRQMPGVVALHENDTLNLIGLQMKVLNAWDSNVDRLERNLCNNGSLMFMIMGRSEKMLFCADVEKEREELIIAKHGNELRADYVQLAHHGNWGLSMDFYKWVGAQKGVFADAPSYILDDVSGRYDGPQLKQWFMNRGIPYYRFTTVPNTIILH